MSDLTPEMPPIPSAASTPPPVPPPVNPYAAPYADVSPPTLSAEGLSSDIRTKAMLCHLLAFSGVIIPFPLVNILGPLILWQTQKDKSPFIDYHGKESVNFQITVGIAVVISFVLMFLLIGFLLLPAVGIYAIVMTIIAGIKANEGQYYRYPFTIRFIK